MFVDCCNLSSQSKIHGSFSWCWNNNHLFSDQTSSLSQGRPDCSGPLWAPFGGLYFKDVFLSFFFFFSCVLSFIGFIAFLTGKLSCFLSDLFGSFCFGLSFHHRGKILGSGFFVLQLFVQHASACCSVMWLIIKLESVKGNKWRGFRFYFSLSHLHLIIY